MAGAPGLGPPLGDSVSLRQFVQFLINVFHRDFLRGPVADGLLEIRLDGPLDDKHDFAETLPDGVVDGIVDDHLPGGAHRSELLESSEAAAHTGGHDY